MPMQIPPDLAAHPLLWFAQGGIHQPAMLAPMDFLNAVELHALTVAHQKLDRNQPH